MATIKREVSIAARPNDLWDAISDVGALHSRVAPGMVLATRIEEGGAVRNVEFANGAVLREQIISNDARSWRLAWTAAGGPWTHHNASLEVLADGEGHGIVVWTADVLPHDAAPLIEGFIEQGLATMKAHFERHDHADD